MRITVIKKKNRFNRWPVAVAIVVLALLMVGCGVGLSAFASSPPLSPDGPALSDNGNQPHPLWPHEKSSLQPDPAIVFGRLENGFRYVLMQNKRPEDRVSVHLFISAGSLNETDGQQGVAHFLEHMLFNGSTHFPPGELVRYFQNIGMQFGNDANAHTGFDETVYDVLLPSGDEESLKKGLLVVSDYAMGALLLESEVNRERGVILAEKRSRDSVDYRTFKKTLEFELPDFLASRRMPIGTTEVIQKADRSLLKAYYDAWYRPDNMVLVMVGDFQPMLAEGLIKNQFKNFTARAPAQDRPSLGTINHDGVKVFYHHEPESGGTTVSIEVLQSHEPVPDSQERRRQQLVEAIYDRIFQNRLDSRLKEKGAPFTSAAAGSGVYLNHIRYAEISADSADGDWRGTLSVLEQELRRAIMHGFNESELMRVKKTILNRLENKVREAPTRDSTQMARGIMRDLAADRVTRSPEQEKTSLSPLVESITLAEVHQAFKMAWPEDHRLILVTGNVEIGDASSPTPEKSILDLYQASIATEVQRPSSKNTVAFPYLEKPTRKGVIASNQIVEDLGITRIQFENGVRINIKPTDYKTNEVLANLIFGHGKSSEPKNSPGLSLLSEAAIEESGLGAMATDELERALSGRSTYVDFRISETHFNFFAETVSDELELLFQLLYTHIVDPGFRDDAVSLAKERLRQEYASLSRSIDGMMRIEGLRLLAGGDSRFGIPPFEKIQVIETDDVRKWILPVLENAPLELSIVGDFDKDHVIELSRRYLGSLNKRGSLAANLRNGLPYLPTGTVNRIHVDTQISKAMVVAAWQTDDFWNIHRTRRLSVLSDVFSERLRQRIRETLGASYSPFAFNRSSHAFPGYGVFQAYVSVSPDQTDKVLAEVRAIADNLANEGVSKDELKRALDPILNSIKALRQTNGYWLNSVLTGSQRHPEKLEWARHFIEDYAAITAKELGALSADYLIDENSSAIIIEPKP